MHPLTILLPSLLFLFFLYKRLFPSKQQNLPPSPPKLPILGHLLKLGTHPHHSLRTLSNHYGELMLIYLGQNPTLIVSSSKMAKEIMKTHDSVTCNRTKTNITEKLLYNRRNVGAAPYGDYWRQTKTIYVVQLLNTKRVKSFRHIREEETLFLMEKIAKNNGLVFDLGDMLVELTNDVICRVAFGRKYGENKGDFKGVLKELEELLMVFDVGDFVPWLGWVSKVNGLNERLDKCAKKLDGILDEIVQEHMRLGGENQRDDEEDKVKNLIDVLLDIQKENSAVDRDTIKALILDAFAAGTDTSYSVLEWAMAEILKNPNVLEQLQKEVRQIGGRKDYINEDDLDKMNYLKAVLKETLRLHPPIPLLVPRETTQDIKIDHYKIPSRTRIMINAWAIQRDPAIWENPQVFYPERFLNSSIDFKGQDFELIPFGSGRRICPGISFAMTNNELVLANLMYKFNWSLPEGVEGKQLDMTESFGLTVHRTSPLLVVASLHVE